MVKTPWYERRLPWWPTNRLIAEMLQDLGRDMARVEKLLQAPPELPTIKMVAGKPEDKEL